MREAAGTKGGVGGREDHVSHAGAVDNGVIGNADVDNVCAIGGEPQAVRRHMRRGPCIRDPVSVCA
jgi:hypothetical protein